MGFLPNFRRESNLKESQNNLAKEKLSIKLEVNVPAQGLNRSARSGGGSRDSDMLWEKWNNGVGFFLDSMCSNPFMFPFDVLQSVPKPGFKQRHDQKDRLWLWGFATRVDPTTPIVQRPFRQDTNVTGKTHRSDYIYFFLEAHAGFPRLISIIPNSFLLILIFFPIFSFFKLRGRITVGFPSPSETLGGPGDRARTPRA